MKYIHHRKHGEERHYLKTGNLLFQNLKDLCVITVYTCLKIYLYKKALFIFVNNVTFFSMLYHGAVEYVANTWICVYMIVK